MKEPARDVELEAKFLVRNLVALDRRAADLGAEILQERIFETNLRFDLPDGNLAKTHRVLRLRQDRAARLTYKGPGRLDQGIQERTEIEVVVGDFAATRRVIEALGYEISMIYEKYRSTRSWQSVTLFFDEMPYGNFVEIEGDNVEDIREACRRLGLNWEARIPESYAFLFDLSRRSRSLSFRDLTFENYRNISEPHSDFPYPFAD